MGRFKSWAVNILPSFLIKPKMPCFSGGAPVWKLAQAVEVSGGMVLFSVPETPFSISLFRKGSFPCLIQGSIIFHVAPSSPKISNDVCFIVALSLTQKVLGRY